MFKPARFLRTLAVTVTIGCVVGLTGCANPIEQLVNKGVEGGIEKLIEQGTGGKLDLNTEGGGFTVESEDGKKLEVNASGTLPEGWPGLPVPAGKLNSSVQHDGTYMLQFTSTVGEAKKLVASLTGLGFAEESSADMGPMSIRSLENAEFKVSVTWITDEGDDDGAEATLQYMVLAAGN